MDRATNVLDAASQSVLDWDAMSKNSGKQHRSRCRAHGPNCEGHATRAKKKRAILEIAQVLALVDSRADVSERAVLLVAYDLALRACEVRLLAAGTFDAQARTVDFVPAKDGEEEPLGIAQRTADAIDAVGGLRAFVDWQAWKVKRLVRRAAIETGLPARMRYSHILRKSRATHMLEATPPASIKDIQRRLRHKSEQTTLLYLGITPTRARTMDAVASAMIDGPQASA